MLHPTFSFRPPFTLVPGYLWEVKMLGYWIYAVLVLPDTISCLQNAILIYIPIGTTQDCPLNSFTNSWHYGTLVFFLAPIWWQKYFTIVLLFISPIILKFGQLFTFINQLFFYLFITHPFNNQRPVSTCWAEFHRIHLFFLSLKKKKGTFPIARILACLDSMTLQRLPGAHLWKPWVLAMPLDIISHSRPNSTRLK